MDGMPPIFVTICTKDRENFFGEIISDNMILSKTGVIADLMWYEIKTIRRILSWAILL
jgi:hypothetical protein